MKKTKVLVFPSGAENALNIINSLKYNLHFEIFGATNKHDHSEYVLDNDHLFVDSYDIHSDNFINLFNALLSHNHIDYIIPTHDEISFFLLQHQDEIQATVVASPLDTCEVAFSKIKTFARLAGASYLPTIYSSPNEITIYPVFIKPDHGVGGRGARIIKTSDELKTVKNLDSYLISDFLPGEEYTIDCFTNRHGNLLFVGPRTRERITHGVSFRSRNIELDDELYSIAKDINSKLQFRGLWFFQVKKDKNNNYKLMEISVRCAGTMDLYREKGVNFPCLALFDFMGYDVDIICNNYNIELDRCSKSHYRIDYQYEHVYIDFDDTIIVNEKINLVTISFLYQCINRHIPITLLTKHETDIYNDLKKYKINDLIFDEIVQIQNQEEKSDYIKHRNAIFIDNYFPDRKKVFEKCKIPVFDVDMIESLMLEG